MHTQRILGVIEYPFTIACHTAEVSTMTKRVEKLRHRE